MQKQRIEWIDYAKGIAILLVIVGHCSIPGIIRASIFSFHMPLFFLLSMITFRASETSEQFVHKTERAFLHLIVPMIWVTVATSLIFLCYHPSILGTVHSIRHFVQDRILVFCFASGVKVSVGDTTVSALGIPWFFAVLFVGRTFFDYLHYRLSKTALTLVVALLSICGVLVAKFQWLPFSLDIAMSILPLFLVAKPIGRFVKESRPMMSLTVAFILWALTFIALLKMHGHLELACRSYPVYPMCFVNAILGTLMVGNFSALITKVHCFVWLKTIGRYSLYLLCIHI